jgi:hypothetical protein
MVAVFLTALGAPRFCARLTGRFALLRFFAIAAHASESA